MDSEKQIPLRHVVIDISDVSGVKSFEQQNTITLTKKMEVRSKTFLAVILGVVTGFFLLLCSYWAIGIFSFIFPVLGGILSPFLFVGQTKDTGITRWKRLNDIRVSRDLHGKLFFPNSQKPVELAETELVIFDTGI